MAMVGAAREGGGGDPTVGRRPAEQRRDNRQTSALPKRHEKSLKQRSN